MKNFVECFAFPVGKSTVNVYRELEPPSVNGRELRRRIRAGEVFAEGPLTFSVQFAGSGRYFSAGSEALRYCLDRWPRAFMRWADKIKIEEENL